MSEPHDERLTLSVEQGVLLWCMRIWVADLHHPVGAKRRIQEMLTRLDAPAAAPYLDGFMFALSQGALRKLGIYCVCRPQVGEDERAFLDVFGLAQEARSFEASLLLRGLLAHEGARAALRCAEGLGGALARAGRHLLAPEAEMCRFALATESADAIRRLATLH